MSNSKLISSTILSPNHKGLKTLPTDRITPHCVVGEFYADEVAKMFLPESRRASSNYAIGKDGRICLIVDEANRSICSDSSANDNRAVTIECSCGRTTPYAFSDTVYNRLIELCADICERNGKKKLLWISDKDKALAYQLKADEMLLTVHRWFGNTSCPGDWLMSHMPDLATKVTAKLQAAAPVDTFKPYLVKITKKSQKVRSGPGVKYGVNMNITDKGTYTIVEEGGSKKAWGKLKSGAGWIYLPYVKKL